MFPHIRKHQSNVSVRRWWTGGKDCEMLYFEIFTAFRLGLILTIVRFSLPYRSDKSSIIKVYFKKEKKQA